VVVVAATAAANQSSNTNALIHDTTEWSNEAGAMPGATADTRAEIDALDQAMNREATAAYERGDYDSALKILRPLADQGNARAQYNLGVMALNGTGVAQNDAEAATWFRNAAAQGNAAAQYNLGKMYLSGQGVPRDNAEAAGWYRKAAEQGHANAQYNLGLMHMNGQGVAEDAAQAAGWYVKAADQGFGPAQGSLGLLYATGRGIAQNSVEAYKWFTLASQRVPPGRQRDVWINNRDTVAKTLTAEQIAEADRLAHAWKPKP